MQWFAQAPANIALIKYMGKKDDVHNLPDNPSLSYTLPNLLSSVQLEAVAGNTDYWEPLLEPGAPVFTLSSVGQQRFLDHLKRLKEFFGYQSGFIVRSSNNFPQGSGLASSASSFAALTMCAVRALCELTSSEEPSLLVQAQLSRLGSGSSCRSFFAPWVLWDGEDVAPITLPYAHLMHQVILISHAEKHVSSREAHKRVKQSDHYAQRTQRAEENLGLLLEALRNQDWHNAYLICWREFQDMHRLFSSSEPSFSYMTEESQKLLMLLQDFWEKHGDGPIVTMDAGPNIHLLYRPDQVELMQLFKQHHLVGNYDVL